MGSDCISSRSLLIFVASFRRKSSLCIDLDIYFRLFITKSTENSACQKDQVTAIFDFVILNPGFRHFVSNFRTLRTRFSPFEPNLFLASLWRLIY